MATLIRITFNYGVRDIFGQSVQRQDTLKYDATGEIVTGKLIDKLINKVIRDMRDKFEYEAILFDFNDGTCEAVWTNPSLCEESKLMWRHDVSSNSSDEPVEIATAQFKRYIKERIGVYPN